MHILLQDGQAPPRNFSADSLRSIQKANTNGNAPAPAVTRVASFNSSQVVAQRKLFAESQIGRTSFHKLLEPSSSQKPGMAPYRIVLGDVKEKVLYQHKK